MIIFLMFFIFNFFSTNVFSGERGFSIDLIYAGLERFSWVIRAFYGSGYSLDEIASLRYGAHSTITTAIFDYSVFYFIMLLILMFYFLLASFSISKYHYD